MSLFSVNVDTFGLRCQMQRIARELHELNANVKNGFFAIDKDLKAINEDFDILVGKIPKEAIIAREMAKEYTDQADFIWECWTNVYGKWDEKAPSTAREDYEYLRKEAEKYRELHDKIMKSHRERAMAEAIHYIEMNTDTFAVRKGCVEIRRKNENSRTK